MSRPTLTANPPAVLPDGSILYDKTGQWQFPGDRHGYIRDADNKWLFHPTQPVPAQEEKVRAKPILAAARPDLQLALPAQTGEFQATIQSDGSILYEKIGWEPPASINGYVRDKANKWLFHPLWPVCATRVGRAYIRGSCGCIQVEMKCQAKSVSVTDCRTCKME